MGYSTAELRTLWAPACHMRPAATFTFWSGALSPGGQ